MGAEEFIKADRDGWKLRCEVGEAQLAEKTKRVEELEALLVVCEKLGMVIESRPAFEGFAVRNLRAQEAEHALKTLEGRYERLNAEEARRSRRIIDFCAEVGPVLGYDTSDWRSVNFDEVLRRIKEVKALRDKAVMTLDKVSALVDRRGETVVEAVKRVLDELAMRKAGAQ